MKAGFDNLISNVDNFLDGQGGKLMSFAWNITFLKSFI